MAKKFYAVFVKSYRFFAAKTFIEIFRTQYLHEAEATYHTAEALIGRPRSNYKAAKLTECINGRIKVIDETKII